MIITECAACAAPLPRLAKQCSRCQMRYCGLECQKKHWEEGGHDKLCKKIRKGGGAEQYHANEKYAEAVAVAAEACAEDTKGQTCYICTEAVHWKTKDGLVRGCACRGTAGFAHVSCLAEQAKILVAEAEENNLRDKVDERFRRWRACGLCEQHYHGVVRCAFGWACWKTYLGRPESDKVWDLAISVLGNGLSEAGHHEHALPVYEAELAMKRRLGASAAAIFVVQSNLASTYQCLGQLDQALGMQHDVYDGHFNLFGEEFPRTFEAAINYASTFFATQRLKEAKALLIKTLPVARRVNGESHEITLKMRSMYACSLHMDTSATLDDLREAVSALEDVGPTARRVLGGAHPLVGPIDHALHVSRAKLKAREASAAGDVTSICGALEAISPGDA